MKIKISYFYNIRFFKPYQIPISTAVWDPKWFHDGKKQNYYFKDKNGVYNGLRAEMLAPGFEAKCSKTCRDNPDDCSFIVGYKDQISTISFNAFIEYLESIANYVKTTEHFDDEPEIILMVYETPENKCSERGPLVEWFSENGIKLEEWKNSENDK